VTVCLERRICCGLGRNLRHGGAFAARSRSEWRNRAAASNRGRIYRACPGVRANHGSKLFSSLSPARFDAHRLPYASDRRGHYGARRRRCIERDAIFHGTGNGILTIARGTLPLAIFGPENYGYRLGILGAPARTAQALAPLAFSLLIDHLGGRVIIVSSALSLLAFGFAQCHNRPYRLIDANPAKGVEKAFAL
jgi:hypothetical protein